jgi:anti-anti-sigma factor
VPLGTAVNDGCGDFTIEMAFVGTQAVLRFRGEMDLVTAPTLGTFFDRVIAAGYRSVELDLARCGFLDASGLRVIAQAADRLVTSGGELAIRSPSAMVTRVLGISGLDRVVRLMFRELGPHRLGPEQLATAPAKPATGLVIRPLRVVTAPLPLTTCFRAHSAW